jgi:hypothetical protein
MNNENNNNIKKNDEDDYIKNKINSVFQPLILQMSLEQPKEPIKYMIEYLMKFSGQQQNSLIIQKEYKKLKSLQNKKNNNKNNISN